VIVSLEQYRQGQHDAGAASEAFRSFIRTHVFGNPHIWILSIANFFVYTMRYALLDWGPTLLGETRGIKISTAAWMIGAFEGSGVLGGLAAGWITDKLFGGRGARTSVFWMFGCMGAILVFAMIVFSPDSVRTYRRVAAGALFLSFVPDVLLATSHDMGGGWSEALFLMIMHVVVWAICVTVLPGLSMTSHSETAAKPDRPLSIL